MFKTGDTVLVNVPYKNLLDGMSRYNGRTAIINSCPRDDGWYRLDGADYLEFREDWLSSPEDASPDVKAYLRVPGAKDDVGKPPVDLLYSSFPRALLELARVAGDGAKKYTKDGWVHVEDGEYRYANAAGRHALKRWIDGEEDPESGHRHLAHQAWNILAVLELSLRNEEITPKTS